MTEKTMNGQQQSWAAAAAVGFGLGQSTAAARVSDDEPISRCHVFRLESGEGTFALKVYPMGWWPDRLYRAHATMEYLHGCGFPAPRPLRTTEGDRVMYLGERPAICTTWLGGDAIWDAGTRQWADELPVEERLQVAMTQLALAHVLLAAMPLPATRLRAFPPIPWFTKQLNEMVRSANSDVALDGELIEALRRGLEQSALPEPGPRQHVLIDCHPGQFLFDGEMFCGLIDYDHVATACRVRDLAKFLATDVATIRLAPRLVSDYLSVGELDRDERRVLPKGMLRYLVAGVIQALDRAIQQGTSIDLIWQAHALQLEAFASVADELWSVLDDVVCPPIID